MEKAYEICKEMLLQRGFEIVDEEDERITCLKKDGSLICVFLSNIPKLDVERIKDYITLMNELTVNHSIIVYKNTVTPYAKQIIQSSEDMLIEIFSENELQYNPTKHRLVPKHEILNEEEAKNFKEKYNGKFGGILVNDPISRFYGYKKGDVIRIIRNSNYITYRIVK